MIDFIKGVSQELLTKPTKRQRPKTDLVGGNKIGLPQKELDKTNKRRMNENTKINKTNKR